MRSKPSVSLWFQEREDSASSSSIRRRKPGRRRKEYHQFLSPWHWSLREVAILSVGKNSLEMGLHCVIVKVCKGCIPSQKIELKMPTFPGLSEASLVPEVLGSRRRGVVLGWFNWQVRACHRKYCKSMSGRISMKITPWKKLKL